MALLRVGGEFETRYSPGGDEFILAEFHEAMSLETNLYVQQVAEKVQGLGLPGVVDVCPANISYLLRYDPEIASFQELTEVLSAAEEEVRSHGLHPIETRIIDLPILFQDPWTHEVVMRFRDRVQDPTKSDIEYLADLNGLDSPERLVENIERTPGFVTMTGFVPGVLCTLQLVERAKQIEAPKYLRPRTETPERALGFGGTSHVVYPVPGPGGYQLVGRAAAPVYDPSRRLPDFQESAALVRIADIYNYRSITRDEYDQIQDDVAAGTFEYRKRPVTFDPAALFADPESYCEKLKEELYDD